MLRNLKKLADESEPESEPVRDDYDLVAFSKLRSDFEDVKYEAYNFKDGELANENKLRESANYAAYKEVTQDPVPKFKFNGAMIRDFKEVFMPEITPLFK